jgi:hypothetical protein
MTYVANCPATLLQYSQRGRALMSVPGPFVLAAVVYSGQQQVEQQVAFLVFVPTCPAEWGAMIPGSQM